MPEISQIEISQIAPYIQSLTTISEILFFPFMLFIIYLTFMLHLSTICPKSNQKINTVISSKKKSSLLLLILLRFYQQGFYYYYSSYISSEELILSLLSESMIQMALIVAITFITVQNMKMISLPFKHLIRAILSIVLIDYVVKIYIEVYYGVFTLLITFSTSGTLITLYATILFFRYPTNEHVHLLSSHIAYVELQEILNYNSANKNVNRNKHRTGKGGLINNNNNNNSSKQFKPNQYITNKPIIINASNNRNLNANTSRGLNIVLNEIKAPLKQTIDYIPTIKIAFKSSFHINRFKNTMKQSIDFFFTNIAFDFTATIQELYITNKVKRTLNDFAQLERSLFEEINEANFSKSLVDKIPALNLNITNISNLNEFVSNSDVITTIKRSIEHFLKQIVNEPGLITHNVLSFLDVLDNKQLDDFYSTYRKKYFISESIKLNIYNDLSRKLAYKPDKQISKSMHFSVIESIPNKLFEKEYTLTLRVRCENSFKVLKKNLSDTLLMLAEANQQKKEIKIIKEIIHLSSAMKSSNRWAAYNKFLNDPIANKEMTEFINQLETALTFISSNYLQYKSNIIISEYYEDFYSSFNFQSNPIQHQSSINSSSKSLDSENQDKFEALLNENLISYIDIIAKNFIFISIDFKTKVFYEIAFKIISKSQDLIVLNKRYKFKEIKHYIDVMNTSLGLTNLIPLPFTVSSAYSHTQDLNMKSKERLSYLQKALNAITNHKFFLRITYWKELIYLDLAFSVIQKQKESQANDARLVSNQSSLSSQVMSESFYNSLIN